MTRTRALLAGLVGLTGVGGPALAADQWVAVTTHVQCMLDNADHYRDSGQSVLMIVLSACPEADIGKALASLTQNSAVPGIGVNSASDVDNVIVYTPEELACLKMMSLDLTGATTMLPKKPTCGP